MNDEGGVLENLPRSRPGQRSSKRSGAPAGAAKKAKPAAKKTKPAANKPKPAVKKAKPATKAKPKPRTTRPKPAAEQPPPVREAAESAGSNPVGEVVSTVSSVAGASVRAARDVAREVLRRLPRP